MRSKFSSESVSRWSFSKNLLEIPNSSEVLAVEKNFERNETRNNSKRLPVGIIPSGSEEATSFLNPSTSQAVGRILKAAELELATSWSKSAACMRSDELGKATASLSHDNKADLVNERNDGKSLEFAIKETMIASLGCLSTSNLDCVSHTRNPAGAEFSSHFDFISASAAQNTPEQANNCKDSRLQKETSTHQIGNEIYAQNHSFELSMRPVAEFTSSEPILSSIAVSKPDIRPLVSSNIGIGFTFPVSESFGVMSEPPTPSVIPSSLAMESSRRKPVSTVPSYSFGSKRASPPLVFSFSGGSIPSNDASDLKFNFASDENSRPSFKSVGEGAICS